MPSGGARIVDVALMGAKPDDGGDDIPPLPEGWEAVESQSHPGQVVYENIYTGERISWEPKNPASEVEGESQDIHQPIPINVNVNAVFSKYSITPLKTINFGPMQYGKEVSPTGLYFDNLKRA